MSKVTSKYQITIPIKVRKALNIMPGIDIGFKEEKNKYYIIKNPNSNPVEKWRGVLRNKKQSDDLVAELRGYGLENID